jgi:hypothetical protein
MLAPGVRHNHGTVFTADGGRALLALLSGGPETTQKPTSRGVKHLMKQLNPH